MGATRWGAPRELISSLKQGFGIRTFVETGTHLGATAHWASELFESVVTVEMSEHYYRLAVERYGGNPRIKFIQGDSRVSLEKTIPGLAPPILFWLDAHWSGGETAGVEAACPLLEELGVINRAAGDAFILIDDARMFLAPPAPPHRAEQWPDLVRLVNAIAPQQYGRFLTVVEDVIIAVPEAARPVVNRYCFEAQARAEIRGQRAASQISRGVERIRALYRKMVG
jgi:hypothetical protein